MNYYDKYIKHRNKCLKYKKLYIKHGGTILGGGVDIDLTPINELLDFIRDKNDLLVIRNGTNLGMQSDDIINQVLIELSTKIIPILNNRPLREILKTITFPSDIVTIGTNNFIDFYHRFMEPERYRCAQNLNAFFTYFLNAENVKDYMIENEN